MAPGRIFFSEEGIETLFPAFGVPDFVNLLVGILLPFGREASILETFKERVFVVFVVGIDDGLESHQSRPEELTPCIQGVENSMQEVEKAEPH